MNKIRFVMIGGFLGAGKTTTIGRLADIWQQQGLRVGIVTNDQAADLVDTLALRARGFPVGEVAGACFCCKFSDLAETITGLAESETPDVIVAEPVGSCTDLVATVLRPLRQFYGDRLSIAPYGVIIKPSHGQRVLQGEPAGGFSPQAAYILQKQIEEADFIIINRMDQLAPAEAERLTDLIRAYRGEVPVVRISARTGEGFDELFAHLEQARPAQEQLLEVDYDTYAAGEAELGWLNAHFSIRAAKPFDVDGLLRQWIEGLAEQLDELALEAAHVKCIAFAGDKFAVANLIARDVPPELSQPCGARTDEIDVVVNARVAASPEQLESLVQQALDQVARQHRLETVCNRSSSFRPGRPVPTHRMAPA